MSNTPTAKALLFTAYDTECAIFTEMFGEQASLRCTAKINNVWTYIISPSILKFGINTKEKALVEYTEALALINSELKKALGVSTDEPDLGVEYIDWLIQNHTTVTNNELELDL